MKSKILTASMLFFVSCLFSFSPSLVGEPIPGAEIYVELEPDDEPIANVATNNNGEFMFTFPAGIKIPKNGIFSMTITPPKKLKKSLAKKVDRMEKQTIQIHFSKKDGPKFKFVLTWDVNSKIQTKGAFAISGMSET